MKSDKDFFEALKATDTHKEVVSLLSKSPIEFLGFECELNMDEETRQHFGINDSIKFSLKSRPEVQKVKYFYDGLEVNPECYYVRPEDYHPVSTLRILQECISQDTNKPDIKFLEDGKEEQGTNKE